MRVLLEQLEDGAAALLAGKWKPMVGVPADAFRRQQVIVERYEFDRDVPVTAAPGGLEAMAAVDQAEAALLSHDGGAVVQHLYQHAHVRAVDSMVTQGIVRDQDVVD